MGGMRGMGVEGRGGGRQGGMEGGGGRRGGSVVDHRDVVFFAGKGSNDPGK